MASPARPDYLLMSADKCLDLDEGEITSVALHKCDIFL